jgi:hypothetical protein
MPPSSTSCWYTRSAINACLTPSPWTLAELPPSRSSSVARAAGRLLTSAHVQRASAHLNKPTEDRIAAEAAERLSHAERSLLQTTTTPQPLRMHAEYYLQGADPTFVNTLKVRAPCTAQ